VDKQVIYQPSAARICGHVLNLTSKILRIADAMLVETGLPHLSRELLPDCKRESALDTLNRPLHRLPLSRRQHEVQVFWHNDKGVQPESTLVSVSEDRVHQKFGVRGSEKQGSSLKRDGSDGVGINGAPRILVRGKHTPEWRWSKECLSAEINETHTSGPKGQRSLVSLCTG
jgi:hypothetical protein